MYHNKYLPCFLIIYLKYNNSHFYENEGEIFIFMQVTKI